MDKRLLVFQILLASLVIIVLYFMGFAIYKNMEIAITDIQNTCNNLTPETYNITQYHEACKFNETTGKYDLNITVINDVRT
jgi:hypothetical protein